MLEAKKQAVLRNYWLFNRDVVGWKDLYEPLHKPLCEFIQHEPLRKKLGLLPRGHFKSSVGTVSYALWRIAQDPKVRILIANATFPLAATFLSQIKDNIQRNKNFIELFGDLYTSSDKWSEQAITVKREESYERKEPTVTAFGIGGNLVSQHYDVVLLDDLVNRENIHTADRIHDVLMFYKDVLDLLEPDGQLIMFGTRWHESDLYGWILDDENPVHNEFDIYTRTAIEGEYEIIKGRDGRFHIDGGEILLPTKFTREHLEKLINEKGLSEFSAQYMNDPVPKETAIFGMDWKYYEEDDMRERNVTHYIGIDPAFFDPQSKNPETDFTAMVVVAIDEANNWFIRDIVKKRMTPKEILEMMFELDAYWKPKTIALESTAYQKVLSFQAREMMRDKNQFLPITELKHAGRNAKSKYERIQALEPRYAVGSIFHNIYVRQMTSLEDELRRFPRAKTDDVADALANILEVARPPARTNERAGRSRVPLYPA